VLLFDANGDGFNDLLVTKGGNSLPPDDPAYQPKLFLNDGHGHFQPAASDALPTLTNNIGAVAAADFTHNGTLGLFLGGRVITGQYPFPAQSVLLVNRKGKFEDVTEAFAPGLRNVGMVTAALWSDVDGDGWADLLVALEWGQVKYFHNNAGQGLDDWTDKAGFSTTGSGWWTSLAAADFNGDGKLDYVVGNVGLNTQYQADAQHPAVLFAGDFKGDGSSELIEAYYEGDKLYPWRSRRNLVAVFPALARRYPTADSFSTATVTDIFGEKKITAAQKFTATELRSGVFLSQKDGTYKFSPLPRIAQISPLQGLVAGDFDGDGHADIYAVENSFAPIPSVGRNDGGLSQLLLGDGHGEFRPVPPLESHLLVRGDAKALAVIDLDHDGWPDFVVSRNNTTTLAFRNRGKAGHHSLRVILHGPPGNPTGVGARVILETSDGTAQISEVYAGSGYYSQSSAACFFGYVDGNPPKTLHVRWATGESTEASVPAEAKEVVITFNGKS
ncbi:MAG TPA: CRTAC1 family protein, partial [Opitutaceae bacterium]